MLYETAIPCPYPDTYEQHRFLEKTFRALTAPQASRSYVWCCSDDLLYVRRRLPTQDLPWRPVQIPPVGSLINFQLKARCRDDVRLSVRWIAEERRVQRAKRRYLEDPGDCLAWLERNGKYMGLQIEDAEVEEVSDWIDRQSNLQAGFTLRGRYFEGFAQVVDRQLFERGLAKGCGDSKAFGFGFMFFWGRGQHAA